MAVGDEGTRTIKRGQRENDRRPRHIDATGSLKVLAAPNNTYRPPHLISRRVRTPLPLSFSLPPFSPSLSLSLSPLHLLARALPVGLLPALSQTDRHTCIHAYLHTCIRTYIPLRPVPCHKKAKSVAWLTSPNVDNLSTFLLRASLFVVSREICFPSTPSALSHASWVVLTYRTVLLAWLVIFGPSLSTRSLAAG